MAFNKIPDEVWKAGRTYGVHATLASNEFPELDLIRMCRCVEIVDKEIKIKKEDDS